MDLFPEALIPQTLLKENLRESYADDDEKFDHAQGELLALGITRYVKVGGGQWKRLCVAFPTGELRTNISINLEKPKD